MNQPHHKKELLARDAPIPGPRSGDVQGEQLTQMMYRVAHVLEIVLADINRNPQWTEHDRREAQLDANAIGALGLYASMQMFLRDGLE